MKADEAKGWIPVVVMGGIGLAILDGISKADSFLFGEGEPGADQAKPSAPTGQKQTLTDLQVKSIADILDMDMNHNAFTDQDEVVRQLIKPNNDADVQAIIKAYGTRRGYFFSGPWTLPARVTDQIDADLIANVNASYSDARINYRW